METRHLTVTGMSCGHCEKAVANAMEDLNVKVLEVSHEKNLLSIEFDPSAVSFDAIKAEIVDMEYGVA